MHDAFFPEIQQRQQRLLPSLGCDVLILASGVQSSGISRFRQDSDFFYLTGFPEHGAVLVMDASGDGGPATLFVRENSQKEQVWNGFTIGVEKAQSQFPVDQVQHIDDLQDFLQGRLKGRRVHYKPVSGHESDAVIKQLQQLLDSQGAEVTDRGEVFDALCSMRMVKSPLEVETMREAIKITGEAHHACMRAGTRYRQEYQFEAEFEYHCKMQGSLHFAFGTIIAAGNHGTCQHYVENSGPVRDSDLVLIDAGAMINGYCADLTRTFPASGKFTPVQRDLYEVVLASQKAGVEMVAPGRSMMEIHLHSAAVLVDGMKGLGLVKGSTQEFVDSLAYKEYWPGALSHSLGLDVHDVLLPGYHKGDKTLKPGMVITVEPGFYSQSFNEDIPEPYRQIGIRIEDDLLVTEDGYENLSSDTVKEIAEVEAMVQSGR